MPLIASKGTAVIILGVVLLSGIVILSLGTLEAGMAMANKDGCLKDWVKLDYMRDHYIDVITKYQDHCELRNRNEIPKGRKKASF